MTTTTTTDARPTAVLQRLRCKNDVNGNPRRIYALHATFHPGEDGRYNAAGWFKRTLYTDEGYEGARAARRLIAYAGIDPTAVADLGDAPGALSPTDYREICKSADFIPGQDLPDDGVA